jgi:hypothetical protein
MMNANYFFWQMLQNDGILKKELQYAHEMLAGHDL